MTIHTTYKILIIGMCLVLLIGVVSSAPMRIAFVSSNTMYSAENDTVFATNVYENRTLFAEDVGWVVNASFMSLDKYVDNTTILSDNYRDAFNITIVNGSVNAFGKVPRVEGSPDLVVVLYPHYIGTYSDAKLKPPGLDTKDDGRGYDTVRIPADDYRMPMFIHEVAHAQFGLGDTYCGNTHYQTGINIWKSYEECFEATNNPQCVQIKSDTCSKPYWKIQTADDLMQFTYAGARFDHVSSINIRKMLSKYLTYA
jgi:hypothetical protein